MSCVKLSKALAFIGAAAPLAALAVGAQAYTLVIGNSDSANAFPFGTGSGLGSFSPTYSGEYQQAYSSTYFSGPTTIDSIGFTSNNPDGLGNPGTYTNTFTLALGYTSNDPDALSSTFADNPTSETQVFDGLVSGDLEGSGNVDYIIPITPFTYDPSQGNLIMDIDMLGGTGPGTMYFNATDDTPGVGRAYSLSGIPSDGAFSDADGLETSFDVVPEPSPVLSLGAGLLMIGGLLVYKRKRLA